MKSKYLLNKKTLFFALFAAMVLIGKEINFSAIVGADSQFFTLYQFFGPIAGKFLGITIGVASVLTAQLIDFLIKGKEWELINLLRMLPMLLATFYFSSKKRLTSALIPAACIVLFILHPVGCEAWLFSMYWLIPIMGRILPNKVRGRLFFQSFGATFTAHAVGSVLWLYTVPMTSAQWLALIPIVALERFWFGTGIAGSFVVINTALGYLVSKLRIPSSVLNIDKDYILNKQKEAVAVRA